MPVRHEQFYFGLRVTSLTRRRPPANGFEPGYLALHRSGELAARAREGARHLEDCDLCARYCHANRKKTLDGIACATGELPTVASFEARRGDEDCLCGWRGSGTICFAGCAMRGVFCQNWDARCEAGGNKSTAADLAELMLDLQAAGCHNINLACAGHTVAQVLAALPLAAEAGLRLPLVWNSNGYDSPEALALLDGVVDIYLPEMRYGVAEMAGRYSQLPDYVAVNRAAVAEMHRQVGDLRVGADGIARRGLLVRHLVLPGGIAGTGETTRFLAESISPNTWIDITDQYRPSDRAREYPELDRPITAAEYAEALAQARAAGLTRIDRRCSAAWLVPWP